MSERQGDESGQDESGQDDRARGTDSIDAGKMGTQNRVRWQSNETDKVGETKEQAG